MVNADAVEILLVEDNPQHVELTLRALRKHNLANHVLVVKDGAEALEFIFATHRYHQRQIENGPKVILLDLKLPKVNGLEVLRRIKSNERTKGIPVVVVTTSEQGQDVVKSYKLGANSYIVKPVSFEKFDEAVSQLGFYWMLLNKLPS
jgi:two-component system response regulator